jgi:hypothetical protein
LENPVGLFFCWDHVAEFIETEDRDLGIVVDEMKKVFGFGQFGGKVFPISNPKAVKYFYNSKSFFSWRPLRLSVIYPSRFFWKFIDDSCYAVLYSALPEIDQ